MPAIPMRPKGSGDTGASAALALLDDVPASPASRRLASAPAAPRTRPIVLSPRAARCPGDAFNAVKLIRAIFLVPRKNVNTFDLQVRSERFPGGAGDQEPEELY